MHSQTFKIGLLGVALLVPFVLRAQQATTRPVTIQVCDQIGAPIAHAQIRLVPAPDPASTKLETDEHGNLSLNLKAGGYSVVVSAQGFKNWSERIYVATPSGEASTNQLVPVVLRIGDFGSPMVYPKDSLVHAFDPYTIKGKVFRSDSNEAISNSYILLMQEKDSPLRVEHFDVRTDEKVITDSETFPLESIRSPFTRGFGTRVTFHARILLEQRPWMVAK